MTDEMMNLRSLVEKSADTDLLREMIGFATEKLMQLEVGAKTGAAYGAKDTLRLAQRNGFRERDWRRGPERWNCVFRSCAPAAISRAFSNRAAWPRRP